MGDRENPAANLVGGASDGDAWEQAFQEVGGAPVTREPAVAPPAQPQAAVRNAKGLAKGDASPPGGVNLDFLLDVSLNVTVEIGRSRMPINELLQLGQGSVIELDRMVGEPCDVFVNNKLMARGEVVTVNERFGIRLTDIIDPRERIQQLG